mgnify:CR=1 FL=1
MSKAYLLVICLLSASFTGCLSEIGSDSDKTETYQMSGVWNFGGSFAPDSNQDPETVNEFVEDLVYNNSFENKQNITWKKYEHNFTIESRWEIKYVTLLLTVNYELGGGSEPSEGVAGTLDISIKDPNGGEHADGYEVVTWNNQINERMYLLPVISGTWTITISGSGLEGVGSVVYSGEYNIEVDTDKLE